MEKLFALLKKHLKTVLIACGIFFCVMIIVIAANSNDDSYTTDGAEHSTPQKSSVWTLNNRTDEFGTATGEQYLKATVSGTFDDIMGADQTLKVELQVSLDSVSIVLWERGTSRKEAILLDTNQYVITVLDQNGEKHKFYSYLRDGKPYLAVDNYGIDGFSESSSDLINILKSPGTVKFHIVNSNDKDNTYSFSVKTEEFADLYEQILSAMQETEQE